MVGISILVFCEYLYVVSWAEKTQDYKGPKKNLANWLEINIITGAPHLVDSYFGLMVDTSILVYSIYSMGLWTNRNCDRRPEIYGCLNGEMIRSTSGWNGVPCQANPFLKEPSTVWNNVSYTKDRCPTSFEYPPKWSKMKDLEILEMMGKWWDNWIPNLDKFGCFYPKLRIAGIVGSARVQDRITFEGPLEDPLVQPSWWVAE